MGQKRTNNTTNVFTVMSITHSGMSSDMEDGKSCRGEQKAMTPLGVFTCVSQAVSATNPISPARQQ